MHGSAVIVSTEIHIQKKKKSLDLMKNIGVNMDIYLDIHWHKILMFTTSLQSRKRIQITLKSQSDSTSENCEPPIPTGCRFAIREDVTVKTILKVYRRYLTIPRSFACFQLHPNVICEAEKRNVFQNCQRMGAQDKLTIVFKLSFDKSNK